MSSQLTNSPIDLHVHTKSSDGTYSPAEVVGKAKEAGISLLGITDHDEVGGVKEAAREGERLGIKVIPGVELSVRYKKLSDIHLLGYFPSCEFSALDKSLAAFKKTRGERGVKIVENINRQLESEGTPPLSLERLRKIAQGAVGRPHIAQMLIERGLAGDMNDAFDSFLVPHNVPKHKLAIQEAIRLIKDEGGWPVLAHPHVLRNSPNHLSADGSRKLVSDFARMGVEGLESYYGEYNCYESALYTDWALNLDLFVTIGSDFHGFAERGRMGRFCCGSVPVEQIMKNLPFVNKCDN